MAVLFSPFGNSQYFDENGDPAVGYTVTTYAAGSSTLLATYTDSSGGSANANPVTLNALGLNPAGQFWLSSGLSYKFVVKNAGASVVQTVDGITGTNDPAVLSTADQWVSYSGTPTYISATSFSVAGDQTSTFQVLRRMKSANTAGTIYSTITASSFGAGITTVTVTNDSGSLDPGLSAVLYSLLSATNQALPYHSGQVLQMMIATDAGSTTNSASLTNITASTKSITPKSTSSTIFVEVSFQAAVPAGGSATNTGGGFQLFNSTTSANVGSLYVVDVTSGSGTNINHDAAAIVRASVANTGRAAVTFLLRAKNNTVTAVNIGGINQVWTITEVQN